MLCYIFEFDVKHFMHMISPYTCCARLAKEEKKRWKHKKNRKAQNNTAFSEGLHGDGQRSGNTIKVKAEKFGNSIAFLQFDTLCSARRCVGGRVY